MGEKESIYVPNYIRSLTGASVEPLDVCDRILFFFPLLCVGILFFAWEEDMSR